MCGTGLSRDLSPSASGIACPTRGEPACAIFRALAALLLSLAMAATSKPPRLRESPRLLRGHHHTSLEAPTPPCNASPGSLRPSGIVRLPRRLATLRGSYGAR
jgi:hypothetical protein